MTTVDIGCGGRFKWRLELPEAGMGSRWGWAVVAALAVGLAGGSAEAAPEKGKVYGQWKIDCQSGADKRDRCLAFHVGLSEDGKRVFDVSIGYLGPAGEPVVVVTLPLGISLRDGAALKIDERPLLPLIINTCRSEGCESAAPLDDATFQALRAAKVLAIGVIPWGSKQPVGIPVPVEGLAAAITGLK